MLTFADSVHKSRDQTSLLRTAVLNGIEAANQAVLDLGVGAALLWPGREIPAEAEDAVAQLSAVDGVGGVVAEALVDFFQGKICTAWAIRPASASLTVKPHQLISGTV